MKKSKLLIFISTLLTFSACDFLDFDETNRLNTKENVYKYFNTTKSMLTHVYSFIPQDFGAIGGAMRDCGCDDAEFGNTTANVQYFNTNTWSAIKTLDNNWGLYKGVRAANSFIKEIANVDFSRFENNLSYQEWLSQLKYFPYEARTLRALFFFELAKRYGDIAMTLTVLTAEEANTIKKTPFSEVIDFIVTECDECAKNLPISYATISPKEIGRITKGFAMALKSKALLYAASELHNPSMDAEKWKASAKAAFDIINSHYYQLEKENVNNLNSREVVLFRMNPQSNSFELSNFPVRFVNGKRSVLSNCVYPSQNLVDAFETINGYSVRLTDQGWKSEDPTFNPSTPYKDRDPRFYKTVLFNDASFKDSKIEVFAGGSDDLPVTDGGTPTGYFLAKYIQEGTSFETDKEVKMMHHWVVYRYAETLLTYAESMVQAFGDANYTDNELTLSAKDALNQVRKNAGMPDVTQTDKESFLKAVQNEWRVEFAFEDHRFWDVRRWKIADTTQRELYGVSVFKSTDGTFQFQRTLYETRSWSEKKYLYPIPQQELYNNTNLMPQNIGW